MRAHEANAVVRTLPFTTLRKTRSHMILRLAGEPVQQLYLAHKDCSVAAQHYTGETNFEPLVKPLRAVPRTAQSGGGVAAGS